MESVIFLTTLTAFLTTPYKGSTPMAWMSRMKESGNKFRIMKESQNWFTIKLDDKAYPVFRIIQPDESVVFIVEMEDRKIKLFRGQNDNWVGDADQDLIDIIGSAIEEA
jgi:hypothetical protein